MMKMMIALLPVSNPEAGLSDDSLSFIAAQMSAKAGLKYFGSCRSKATPAHSSQGDDGVPSK
jgi:hypothetical protein